MFVSPNPIGLTDTPDAPPYLKAAWNNRRLLQEAFGRVITDNLAHAPYPHRRSVLEEIEARFPDAIAGTARSPFRSDTDVSTLSSLAQHYGLMTGTAYVADAERAYVNVSNSDLDWQLKRTLDRDQDFICLADHHDHALNADRLNRTLADFMQAYFPVAAPWEKRPSAPEPRVRRRTGFRALSVVRFRSWFLVNRQCSTRGSGGTSRNLARRGMSH